jgi:serine/threonine-protein kinase HipA
MSFRPIKRLAVFLDFGGGRHPLPVGGMLRTSDGAVHFEFDPAFFSSGLSLSPFRLAMTPGPKRPRGAALEHFDGLFGVFADSLPDGWGLLLMSRALKKAGLRYEDMTPLDRLSFVGTRGMGALIYQPVFDGTPADSGDAAVDLPALAAEAERVMAGEDGEVLRQLAALGGTAGGARPKVLVGVGVGPEEGRIVAGVDRLPTHYEPWIVKFRGRDEPQDAGIVEWAYAQTATRVGLEMEATRLFTGGDAPWFGTRRFDRLAGGERLHAHTACGLLHAHFREPSLDYETLLKATSALTRRADDLVAAFRMAAFNIVFHNRDDHSKNFSFLMDATGTWRLAPAYDLTYNRGPGGEHTTSVLGEGRAPGREHLLRLADGVGIPKREARAVMDEVESGIPYLLDLLVQHGVKKHPAREWLQAQRSSSTGTAAGSAASTRLRRTAEDRAPASLCRAEGCSAEVEKGRRKYCAKHGRLSDAGQLAQ